LGDTDQLVLGATSLVGRCLVDRLLADAEVGAVSAVTRQTEIRSPSGVRWIVADIAAPRTQRPAMAARRVYSVSPIWLLPNVLPELIDAGLRRLVAFSSTSRFTKAASPVGEERAVADRLARSEDRVMKLCTASGVTWTILRPTLIYAEGRDANVSRLAALIRKLRVLPLCGAGAGLRQPVHADDLAAGAIQAAAAPAAADRAYNLAGGETLTYRQMVERIVEGLGRPALIVSVPEPLWRGAFTLVEPLLPGATVGMGLRMNEDLTFDSDEARRDFAWRPRAFRPRFDP